MSHAPSSTRIPTPAPWSRGIARAEGRRVQHRQQAADEVNATWRERALNAEDGLKQAVAEIQTQRKRIGELLGQIRDLELDLPADAVQRLVTENATLKQENQTLTAENKRLTEPAGRLPRQLPLSGTRDRQSARPPARTPPPGRRPASQTGGRIVKALRISPQGDVTEVELPDDQSGRFVEALRTLIAAMTIEALVLTSRWDAWLDEDGYANAQPLNTYATALANQYGIPAAAAGNGCHHRRRPRDRLRCRTHSRTGHRDPTARHEPIQDVALSHPTGKRPIGPPSRGNQPLRVDCPTPTRRFKVPSCSAQPRPGDAGGSGASI